MEEKKCSERDRPSFEAPHTQINNPKRERPKARANKSEASRRGLPCNALLVIIRQRSDEVKPVINLGDSAPISEIIGHAMWPAKEFAAPEGSRNMKRMVHSMGPTTWANLTFVVQCAITTSQSSCALLILREVAMADDAGLVARRRISGAILARDINESHKEIAPKDERAIATNFTLDRVGRRPTTSSNAKNSLRINKNNQTSAVPLPVSENPMHRHGKPCGFKCTKVCLEASSARDDRSERVLGQPEVAPNPFTGPLSLILRMRVGSIKPHISA